MLTRLAWLVATVALLEGLAMASCTPGYAGSGYYQTADCGLRLLQRAYSSYGNGYGPGYGYGYAPGYAPGYAIDALNPFFFPTLVPPPLSYGYPGAGPYIPNWYASPYFSQPRHGRRGVYRFNSSPRSVTRVRPPQPSQFSVRPELGGGFGNRFGAGSRKKITRLNTGVWANE